MEPDEITVTVEVPETPAPEVAPEVVVIAEPEATLPTLIELAQQIALLTAEVAQLKEKTIVTEITADVALSQAETAIDIAVEAVEELDEVEEVLEDELPESAALEIEEIPDAIEVVAEMPEIQERAKKRRYFI